MRMLLFQIQIVNGVILVAWRQKVLERQVEYGAKLGHVVLSLARMELDNFYRNVMPVADFFDQRQMLVAVRRPGVAVGTRGMCVCDSIQTFLAPPGERRARPQRGVR